MIGTAGARGTRLTARLWRHLYADRSERRQARSSCNTENLLKNGEKIKVVFIQRSKGYLNRPTLSTAEIGEACRLIRSVSDAYIVVDNCYGEFVETTEPAAAGADMIIGSLIKNPGGGMAESGGYIAGTQRAVELAGYRLTAVGVGLEIGATLGQTKNMFRGLFYAPHTVAQALKTAHFAAYIFEKLDYEASPRWNERRYDIIQTIKLGAPDKLVAFCRGLQAGSPVDAFVSPEPWDMPGYSRPRNHGGRRVYRRLFHRAFGRRPSPSALYRLYAGRSDL